MTGGWEPTRQERRERRLKARRDRMQRHGAALGHLYANAVRRRAATARARAARCEG